MNSYVLVVWMDGSSTLDTWSNRLRYGDDDPAIREIIPLKYSPLITRETKELRGSGDFSESL